jgi:hypothetical protein
MGNAIFPEQATIYITDISVAPADLTSSDAVEAEVTNFSQSGGEEDLESIPVFGGGNIDKINPRTQIEVSFDVILRYDAEAENLLRWDSYKFGAIDSDQVTSSGSGDYKRVYVQWSDGTNYYTRAYNKAKAVTFEPESSAEDYLKGSITFKLSPTEADGSPNHIVATKAATSISW